MDLDQLFLDMYFSMKEKKFLEARAIAFQLLSLIEEGGKFVRYNLRAAKGYVKNVLWRTVAYV